MTYLNKSHCHEKVPACSVLGDVVVVVHKIGHEILETSQNKKRKTSFGVALKLAPKQKTNFNHNFLTIDFKPYLVEGATVPALNTNEPTPRSITPNPISSVLANFLGNTTKSTAKMQMAVTRSMLAR